MYAVKEIFYTLQGEGTNTGRPAVFRRFAGCNLWAGREEDRASAACRFCDTDCVGTDGVGGGKFESADQLARAVLAAWPRDLRENRFVVCTGGEPLLQLDEVLVNALHAAGFRIAIETNGTLPVPQGVDWVCVSPKAGAPLWCLRATSSNSCFLSPERSPRASSTLRSPTFFRSRWMARIPPPTPRPPSPSARP